MAGVLACGPGAALSHRSAADLWCLHASDTDIAVTVPRTRSGPPELEVHSSRMLSRSDFDRLDGIPVTSVARTLLDIAVFVTPLQLVRAVDRAERRDLFDLVAVDAVLSRAKGRNGAQALRRAIAAWRPRYTRSELEDRFQDLLHATSLPSPLFNTLVRGERRSHEVDALWPSHRLAVQLDGFAFHRTRRDRERDAATDADLELAGYRVVRLTWGDVTSNRARTIRATSSPAPIGQVISHGPSAVSFRPSLR
jgi:very-short-patch-repair endonuclease